MSKGLERAKRGARDKSLCIIINRKKVWDDEGVAATIGTLLSLMVFLTFLGMFTNQYIPVWMEDNESSHMNQVIGQLSTLKSGIDLQIITTSGGELTSSPLFTPIQLHADGIPVFASPTVGSLSFTSESTGFPYFIVNFNYTVGTGASAQNFELNATNGGKSGGSLEFKGMNRYYVQQTVAYENGAIILNQSTGEIVLSGISIRIVNYSDDIMVKMNQVSLIGVNKSIGGFGTKAVASILEFANYAKFDNSSGSNLTFSIVTKYGNAWEKYFRDLRDDSVDNGVPSSLWNVSKSSFKVDETVYYTVVVKITNVDSLEYTKAVVSMTMADLSV